MCKGWRATRASLHASGRVCRACCGVLRYQKCGKGGGDTGEMMRVHGTWKRTRALTVNRPQRRNCRPSRTRLPLRSSAAAADAS